MADLIDREKVLEHYRATDPAGTFAYCDSILEFVGSLPSVQPEQVKGAWYFDRNAGAVRCSVCGKFAPAWNHKTNFCPECGSDMRKEGKK